MRKIQKKGGKRVFSFVFLDPSLPRLASDLLGPPNSFMVKKPADAILPRKGLVTRAMSKRLQEDWDRVDKEGLRVLMNLKVDF